MSRELGKRAGRAFGRPLRRLAWLLLCGAALTGCAARLPVPQIGSPQAWAGLALPRQVTVVEHGVRAAPGPAPAQPVWLVVAQPEGEALRWLRLDALGLPDARQVLQHGRWRNDGFIYPNRQARALFAALLFAWMPEHELDAAYGAGNWRLAQLPDGSRVRELRTGPRWLVRWSAAAGRAFQAQAFDIVQPDGPRWAVSPLALEGEAPADGKAPTAQLSTETGSRP